MPHHEHTAASNRTHPPSPYPPSVKLNGNRHITGTLRGFDQFMNLVIDEAVEQALPRPHLARACPVSTSCKHVHARTRGRTVGRCVRSARCGEWRERDAARPAGGGGRVGRGRGFAGGWRAAPCRALAGGDGGAGRVTAGGLASGASLRAWGGGRSPQPHGRPNLTPLRPGCCGRCHRRRTTRSAWWWCAATAS